MFEPSILDAFVVLSVVGFVRFGVRPCQVTSFFPQSRRLVQIDTQILVRVYESWFKKGGRWFGCGSGLFGLNDCPHSVADSGCGEWC